MEILKTENSSILAMPERQSFSLRGIIGFAVLGFMVAACSDGTTSLDAEVDHAGRMRGYVESRSVTDFCPDQAQRPDDVRCTVTRGWDYDRGVTVVRMIDPDGKLISQEEFDSSESSLTPAEQARVEALVRADPRTRDIVNKPGVTFWAGGFVMREPGDRWCDRGSRCIRAIAAIDGGDQAILHSVVDLMRDEVVYPDYSPSGNELVQRPEEN